MTSKPSLVLLPGMLCDEVFWRAQVDALDGIVRVQVPAYGEHDSIEAMALSVLSDAPDRFALAGHSMGGRVAQEIYRTASERVLKLALLSTDYRGPGSGEDLRREAAARDDLLIEARDGMEAFARYWIRKVLPPARLDDTELAARIVAMFARHPVSVLAAQSLAGLRRSDYTDLLARIACPTLICAGAEDRLRPVEVHRDMAERIAGSRLVVIPGAGHMTAMEAPQDVSSALRRWLLG